MIRDGKLRGQCGLDFHRKLQTARRRVFDIDDLVYNFVPRFNLVVKRVKILAQRIKILL